MWFVWMSWEQHIHPYHPGAGPTLGPGYCWSRARALSGINTGSMSWKPCHNPHPTNFWDQYEQGCASDLLKARKQPGVCFSSQKPSKLLQHCFIFFEACVSPEGQCLSSEGDRCSLMSKRSRFRQARTWIVTNTGIWFFKTEVYPFLALDLSISIYSLYSEPCWKMYYILTLALCELRAIGSRNNHLWDYYSLTFVYVRSDICFAQLWMPV